MISRRCKRQREKKRREKGERSPGSAISSKREKLRTTGEVEVGRRGKTSSSFSHLRKKGGGRRGGGLKMAIEEKKKDVRAQREAEDSFLFGRGKKRKKKEGGVWHLFKRR